MLRWDTVFLMICMFLTGALCTLAWVLAFTRRVVDVVDTNTVAVADGKVPEPVCRKVDAWLRRAMKSTPRAVLTLSYPTDKEITMQNHYKQRRMKLR